MNRPTPAAQSTFTPPTNPPLIGWHEAARAILASMAKRARDLRASAK